VELTPPIYASPEGKTVKHLPSFRRVLVAAAAGWALALILSSGAYATTWHVAHPPFTPQGNVPYAPLASVSAVSTSNVWAVGRSDGTALTEHWNGSKWAAVALPAGPCDVFESSCQLTGVSTDPAGDTFAVGTAILNANGGWQPAALAYRWTGQTWAALPVPANVNAWALVHVRTFSASDVWAVGQNVSGPAGAPAATHWDGSNWTSVATPVLTTLNLTMNAVAGSSGRDVWAVGLAESSGYRHKVRHSVAMHYDGNNWTAAAIPDTQGVLDLAVTSATDAWAIGFDGSVLHWNGTTWTVATTLPYAHVIAATSPTDVWVGATWTGSSWAVTHFNGSTWTTSAIPGGIDTFAGASAQPGGKVWIAGGYYLPDGASTGPAILTD
jgi:hypothetical protein